MTTVSVKGQLSMQINDLVNKWSNLQPKALEAQLNAQFTNFIWEYLGFEYAVGTNIGQGLIPDYILYDDSSKPLLVVETKKRTPVLANSSDTEFIEKCKTNALYKAAVGYEETGENGIKQYLSATPAKYGLVFNGDFFQLFRRVDGLILPLTDIQKVTAESLPRLINQLQYYLKSPQRAFVVSIWNRKGGVAKTTNTINIAAVLSAKGKRVLVVDFDPQVDLTRSLGFEPEQFKNKIFGCFDKIQQKEEEEALKLLSELIQVQKFSISNDKDYSISLLPGEKNTLEYFGEVQSDKGYQMVKKQTALKSLLSLVSRQYDYIFIDTSPKTDMLTACSLFAADGVIIPADYDPETLRHVSEISQKVIPDKIRTARKASVSKKSFMEDIGPRILGLVFSNCSDVGTVLEKQIDQNLMEQVHIKVYQTKLRRYDMVPISKFARKPVVFYRPKSPITKLYIDLTKEIFFSNNLVDS